MLYPPGCVSMTLQDHHDVTETFLRPIIISTKIPQKHFGISDKMTLVILSSTFSLCPRMRLLHLPNSVPQCDRSKLRSQ